MQLFEQRLRAEDEHPVGAGALRRLAGRRALQSKILALDIAEILQRTLEGLVPWVGTCSG
jgi:hypothetical protein